MAGHVMTPILAAARARPSKGPFDLRRKVNSPQGPTSPPYSSEPPQYSALPMAKPSPQPCDDASCNRIPPSTSHSTSPHLHFGQN
ncbi:hypothetical protein BS50DRAFT_186847 [Corynespora cassiicola Philippines]|uniref:Uncharacterized protein n=1 Tax=Corynespora cassiicola Philippines TaxID=1448308 RepID=A0A2T2P6X7_CORCC|nr:hypothetical protein BS50DRAFT_186847 [Corynespora cassiicola Philippines]